MGIMLRGYFYYDMAGFFHGIFFTEVRKLELKVLSSVLPPDVLHS